jgi:small-conductance mechanosensitive channel
MRTAPSRSHVRVGRAAGGLLSRLTAAAFLVVVFADPAWAQVEQLTPPEGEQLSQLAHLVRWGGVATSVLVIFVAYWGLRLTDRAVVSLGETFTDRRLLLQKIATFFRFGVYIVSFLMVFFLSFEVDDRLLTLMGGTAAVAFGFALKDLVASVVAGVMIMFDRPFQVGDRVTFGGEYGDITVIGLRSVRLQTLDDNTVTIPNNKFLSDISSSGNYGVLHMMVAMDFHVGIDQDVELACNLVRQATATSRFTYLPNPIRVIVKQVIVDGYVAVRITMKAYVLDTMYEKDFESDVNLRVLETFRDHGIQPPAILHRRMAHDYDLVASIQ